jgi:hypothetical protein
MINTEFGTVSTELITLKSASNGDYAILNRNSSAGLAIYNNAISPSNNYEISQFYSYDHTANILFDYSFTNNAASDIDDIVIDFDTGNNVVYVANLLSGGGTDSNSNIDTTKSGDGWYVYFANNPVSKGTLVNILLYDVDTNATLYSINGEIANDYNGQSIGPTIEYYRHIGLNLTYIDP